MTELSREEEEAFWNHIKQAREILEDALDSPTEDMEESP